MFEVLYTAAHGGFAGQPVPLGGGAAVADQLLEEWRRTRPFPVTLLGPAILGSAAPLADDLVNFSERRYAQFCRAFERAITEEIQRHDPRTTAVLANDVSEGPDFRGLAERRYAIYTIYHVDVVAYVAAIYGRGLVRPETLVHWQERLPAAIMPDVLKLIFDKQRASLRYSRAVIVPSRGVRDVLLRCYPETPAERIHVVPWGAWDAAEASAPRACPAPEDALVLLTLSRISPEKGQDLLLEALLEWERRDDFPRRPLWLFVCGEAAFMQGLRYERRLRERAARLRRTRVVFPGYVAGEQKAALVARANVYVFPSRHESYGLTLVEALRAGLPAVCLDTSGAREVLRENAGVLVPMGSRKAMIAGLRQALARLLGDEALRARMSAAARAHASELRFAGAAARVADLVGSARLLGCI